MGAALVAGMVLAGLNIVLGAPVAGLLVASRLTGDGTVSMGALLAFCVVAGTVAYLLVAALARLGAAHDHLTHRDERMVRRQVPCRRPMAGERRTDAAEGQSRFSALDVVVITLVVVVVVAFEIWFAFFSGSPLDARSGR
jgi:hypothetical protein